MDHQLPRPQEQLSPRLRPSLISRKPSPSAPSTWWPSRLSRTWPLSTCRSGLRPRRHSQDTMFASRPTLVNPDLSVTRNQHQGHARHRSRCLQERTMLELFKDLPSSLATCITCPPVFVIAGWSVCASLTAL